MLKKITAILLTTLALSTLQAHALEAPKGEPVLTITGAVSEKNTDEGAAFDLDMLDKLPGRDAAMQTPWTEGKPTFTGPLLREILKAAGAKGKTLVVKALNDYSAEVPMEDAETLDTMLASKVDGKLLSVRDKGPLMMVYPFDTNPDLYNETYFTRSVWQIKEIEVVE